MVHAPGLPGLWAGEWDSFLALSLVCFHSLSVPLFVSVSVSTQQILVRIEVPEILDPSHLTSSRLPSFLRAKVGQPGQREAFTEAFRYGDRMEKDRGEGREGGQGSERGVHFEASRVCI